MHTGTNSNTFMLIYEILCVFNSLSVMSDMYKLLMKGRINGHSYLDYFSAEKPIMSF